MDCKDGLQSNIMALITSDCGSVALIISQAEIGMSVGVESLSNQRKMGRQVPLPHNQRDGSTLS